MSCIVGFINLAGEPADPQILSDICSPLVARAPDGTGTRTRSNVGLANVLLITSPAASRSAQPFSLDGKVWLTADSHLCGKEDLRLKLIAAGIRAEISASDPELILLAYRAFGESFAQHLVGDFALVIWDERNRRLICARDHVGVRPLFYTLTPGVFVFGSDIDSLLLHPGVSDELDEGFIADFLLFGASIENGATVYKHIKRLMPASCLVLDDRGVRINCYWSPSWEKPIRYSDQSDYTEHFFSIFEKAVAERLPETKVALELTGGMDSSSIAAVAAANASQTGLHITAYTNTCHSLIPEEQEGRYAKMIAECLNIPIQFFASEDYPLFEGFDTPELHTPEPFGNPALAHHYDKKKRLLDSGCRILLTGQMGDTLFTGSSSYFPNLFKTGRFFRLLSDVLLHRVNMGSFTGTGFRAAVKGRIYNILGKEPWQPPMPVWLVPEFMERVDATERWRVMWRMWSELNDTSGQLQRPWMSTLFEDYEALKLPLVVRHPFSDIRLIEFVLAVPDYVLFNKRVLRNAMQGKLPAAVLSRPKEGLPGDLHKALMVSGKSRDRPSFENISSFVDPVQHRKAYKQLIASNGKVATWSTWLVNAPIALAYWMNDNMSGNLEK